MAGRDVARTQNSGKDPGPAIMLGLMGLIAVVVLLTWGSLRLGEKLAPSGQQVPGNPFAALFGLAGGTVHWTTGASIVLALALTLMAGLGITSWALRARRAAGRTRVDDMSKHLAGRQDVRSMSRAATVKANTDRGDTVEVPGVFIGKEVSTGQELWGGWEDLHLDLWGPRQGKTTSRIIPMIRRAPGIVISTSCKRDVVDETVAYRSAVGRVWVFDPQDKAPGVDTAAWYFDPLDYVRRTEWMDGNAAELAEIFNAASAREGSSSDPNAYFYTQATDLLTGLLLAAAIDNRPITDVYQWVSDIEDMTSVDILTASGAWNTVAGDLASKYQAEPRTRSNVFSAAKNMVSCLGRAQVSRWLVPREGAERFSATAFAASAADTLYLVSDEDNPVARPATSILTVAVFKALVDRSDQFPRSRLPVPVSAALDEIANVVAWPHLPNYYSTFGSRGIICDTVLQSYSQGVDLWGEYGMRKLFSSAAIVVVGPGHRDYRFLDELANLIGTHTEEQKSISRDPTGGRSVSNQTVEKQTMTAAEIAAMPRGRMLVLATGRRPMLARMVRWQDQLFPDPDRKEQADR